MYHSRVVQLISILGFAMTFLVVDALASRAIVRFTVGEFEEGAPESQIQGAIEVELNDANGEIVSIEAVSLSINGYAFQVSELGFKEYRNFNIVGAEGPEFGSATGIKHGAPSDFWLLWNKDTGLPKEFAYTGSVERIHISKSFTEFSIDPAP